jgi:glycosyltransferase involved in cell wall biosynthesis
MNILYICNHADIVGGGEYSLFALIEGVRKKGHTVRAIVPGPGDVQTHFEQINIPCEILPMPALDGIGLARYPATVLKMAKRIRQINPDLVHVDGARDMLYAGPAAKLARKPAIWHIRVLDRDGLLDRYRATFAAHIIANSQAVKETIIPLGGRKKTQVIYNGFDLDAYRAAPRADLQQQFGIPSGRPTILIAARISEEKGHDDLIQAVRMLKDNNQPATCLICGTDLADGQPTLKRLLKLKADLELTDEDLLFAGQVSGIISVMKACTLQAVPSIAEPFGRIIIEGWAAGLPVVATNAGGPKELIRDRENGFLTPPKNASRLSDTLAYALKNPELCKKIADQGQKDAEDYSIEKHVEHTLQLYRRTRTP